MITIYITLIFQFYSKDTLCSMKFNTKIQENTSQTKTTMSNTVL